MKESFYPRCPLQEIIQVSALRTSFSRTMVPGDSSRGEFHNFWELILVLEGEMTVATNQAVFTAKQNCLVLLPPMMIHYVSNRSKGDMRFQVLSFDATIRAQLNDILFILTQDDVQNCRHLEQLIWDNFDCNGIVVQPKPDNYLICQEVKSRLELLLISVLSGKTAPHKSINGEYTQIVRFLNKNLHRRLTLEDVAREMNMSISNVKKIFSKYSDIGVIHYFNRCKINHSISLLKGGYSVKEVADKLGFSSQSVFCTAFKSIMGFPPSELRADGTQQTIV